MRLISVSLFCLVTIVAVLAVDPGPSECTSDSCTTKDRAKEEADELLASEEAGPSKHTYDSRRTKDLALKEADELLASKEADADNLERNFDGASKVLEEFEANEHEADPNVVEILQAFLNLKSIGADLNNLRPQCTTAEYDKLIQMKGLMNPTKTKWEYGGSRIRRFHDIMRRSFIRICFNRLKPSVLVDELVSMHNLKRMEIFRIFMKDENVPIFYLNGIIRGDHVHHLEDDTNWTKLLYALYPRQNLFPFDSSTGENGLNEPYITERLNNLFEETCGLIERSPDLMEQFELGSKMLDEFLRDLSILDWDYQIAASIGDYIICKAAKSYNYIKLMKRDRRLDKLRWLL